MFGMTVIAALWGARCSRTSSTAPSRSSSPRRSPSGSTSAAASSVRWPCCVVVFASIASASLAGTLLPDLDPTASARRGLPPTLVPYATVLLPNVLGLGGIFFCLGAR